MASIVTKQLSDGSKAYLVRYRTPNGQQRSKQFARKVDATRFANTTEADISRGDFVDPKAGTITLTDWWAEWYPTVSVRLAANTRDRDQRTFRNHVEPTFGATPLGRIDHMDVARWVTQLAERQAPATAVKCHQVLRRSLQGAVRAGRLRHNPADGVKLPKVGRCDKRALTGAEVERLAEAMDERFQLFVWLGAYCGLRTGEIRGLQWGDIHSGWVHVRRQVTEVAGVQQLTDILKTDAARRRIPVPAFLDQLLTDAQGDAPAGAPVIPGPDGGLLRDSFRARFFGPAVTRAGLGKFSPHELRHTAVTRWVSQGALPQDVARWAGHASVVTILDLYGHSEDEAAERVRRSMDSYARGPQAQAV
jgi:integrase